MQPPPRGPGFGSFPGAAIGRAQLETAAIWNGVVMSSSPFQSLPEGDEDIDAPKPSSRGQCQDTPPWVALPFPRLEALGHGRILGILSGGLGSRGDL